MIKLTPSLSKEYEQLWATCVIDYDEKTAGFTAMRLLKSKARYQRVERATGVPWYWIAICHEREAGGSFSGVLHNGEKIIGTGRKTRLVPSGRGPFDTWEEAAIDALAIKGLNKGVEWNVGRFWYEVERFNGFGYRSKGVPSPYLWSHTNHYKDSSGDVGDPGGGKYVADHVYDPSVHDKQLGAAAVLIALMKADPSITFGKSPLGAVGQPSVQSQPLPSLPSTQGEEQAKQEPVALASTTTLPPHSGKAGFVAALLAAAAWLGSHWYLVVGLGILLVLGYWLWRKSKSKAVPRPRVPKGTGGSEGHTKVSGLQERSSSHAPSGLLTGTKSPRGSTEKPTSE